MIFLLHKLNSCRGNYSREETIRGNTVFFAFGFIVKIVIAKVFLVLFTTSRKVDPKSGLEVG